MLISQEQAALAAKWWADQISNAGSLKNHDNGGKDEANQWGMIFGSLLAHKNKPTVEQVEKFRSRLQEVLWLGGEHTFPAYEQITVCTGKDRKGTEKKIFPERKVDLSRYVSHGLWTDYGPDTVLTACAEYAKINTSVFPIKTGMRFERDGRVMASLGYGSPWVEVKE